MKDLQHFRIGVISSIFFSLNVFKLAVLFLFTLFLVFPGGAAADRFFQRNSTWYEKIPANAVLDSNNNNKMIGFKNVSKVLTASKTWTPTVYRATANTPTVNIINSYCVAWPSSSNCVNPRLWQIQGWGMNVPVPTGALPAQNKKTLECWPNQCTDGKMTIISADGKTVWDLGVAVYFPPDFTGVAPEFRGKYATKYLRRWDLTGTGVLYPDDGLGGPTEAHVPLLHGLITYNEIVNEGEINHAVAMVSAAICSYKHKMIYPSGVTVYPTNRWTDAEHCLLGGERFFLDSSVNCDTITPSGSVAKIVCKALQQYGGIFMDVAGPGYNSIVFEETTGKPYSWAGMNMDLSGIPVDKLKIAKPVCSDCSICPNCNVVVPSPPIMNR